MALSNKDPEEKINVTFDFSTQFTTVTNPEVTVCLKGEEVAIPLMVDGAPVINPSNNKVIAAIQGGDNGSSYDVRCKVTTNTNETVVAKDVLIVKRL